jgi:hypothetical protein
MVLISVQRAEVGDFCVNLFVESKSDGIDWILVGVHGAAREAHSNQIFLPR